MSSLSRRMQSEIERDLREHIEMETRDNIERGMSPEEARSTALRKFGNPTCIAEDTRDVWRWAWADRMLQDTRYALRMLRRNPGFSAVAILTLALGIGMNTAVFSVVNAVLLRPLPYPNPVRLVWITNYVAFMNAEAVNAADFFDWQHNAQTFERMALYGTQDTTLAYAGRADQVSLASISEEFLPLTGARPALGRLPVRGERNAILLSDPAFARLFARNPAIIGQSLTLNGSPATVAGVLPRDYTFAFPLQFLATQSKDPEVYILSGLTPQNQIPGRANAIVRVVGSLRPGVTIEQAHAELETIQARNPQTSYKKMPIRVMPLQERIVGNARRALMVLFSAAALVLLIACVNIANLLLARAASRAKEVAIRTAIGAGSSRMLYQFMVEGLVLALSGGLAGLLLARWTVAALIRFNSAAVPRLAEAHLDQRVLAFAFGLAFATGLLFGAAPALSLRRNSLSTALNQGSKSSGGDSSGSRLRRLFVAAELATALVLVIGAGLLIKSLWLMNARPQGFDPDRILVMKVSLTGPQYRAKSDQFGYFDRAMEQLANAPGVQSAGLFFSTMRGVVEVEGAPQQPMEQMPRAISFNTSEGYFQTMGIRLLAGRWFSAHESSEVMLINQTSARQIFGDSDPIGHRIRRDQSTATIIGIVSDVKYSHIDADPDPELYQPFHQSGFARAHDIVVKTAIDPQAAAPTLQKLVAAIDPTQSVYGVKTLEQAQADSIAPRRFNLLLLGVFAGVALLLALIGIYGVMAYTVTQRTHEIGIRMAIGARRGAIVRMMVQQGLALAVLGLLAGVPAALALTRMMAPLLYQVKPADAAIFVVVSILLPAATVLASFVPAIRAARVDPLSALRHD